MIGLVRTVAPTFAAVSLETAKAHLKMDDDTTDDTLIEALCFAATEYAENYMGNAIMPQTWDQLYDAWPSKIWLKVLPAVATGVVVKYYNTSNTDTTLSTSNYTVLNRGQGVTVEFTGSLPAVYDRDDAIRIIYKAGFSDSATEETAQQAVPKSIAQGVLILIGAMYENREEKTLMKDLMQCTTAERLWFPYRRNF
jgi:uncharacterized phiE125 gp8 family phage protein